MTDEIPDEKDFLTPNEIGKQLKVDPKTIIRWIQSGYLPGIRVGKKYRVERKAYEAFLQRRAAEYQSPDDAT